ncbi:MAG: crotonase/enoyl-CoA hydratase family protein [Thermodesulfobacteriota bacterium]
MNAGAPFAVERDGHIAWLIFNCPEKRNTMTLAFFAELSVRFAEFDNDPDIRVVVIKAEGKSFTAGLDLMEAASIIPGKGTASERDNMRRKIISLQENISSIEMCRKPVIAAVHSHCIGGGVDLISACDIRLAARDAVFSIRETRIGIIADVGSLQRLPAIIGHGWTSELALSGRDFTAEEALTMGLITRLCEDREALYEEAGKLARQIADCPPMTVAGVKEMLRYTRDNGVYNSLAYVAQKNASALPSKDLFEAVSAFMEKRKPVFTGE